MYETCKSSSPTLSLSLVLFILPFVIYFHVFGQYSVWQTMLLQESFDNHMICPLSKPQRSRQRFENDGLWHRMRIELQLVILENTTGEPDLTLYITMTVIIGFIFFEYKLLD